MDSSVDMPSFSLGLDTPSKLFGTGLTPASWSLGGTGLTPSILGGGGGGYSASGWTPSLTSMAGARSELNPFEISLSGGNNSSFSSSSAAKRKPGIDFFDRDDSVTARNSPSSMFDLLATTPSGNGRKRAMSSPAVEVGCGSSSFPFFAQQFQPSDASLSHHGEASFAAGVNGQRSKRPRMASMQSSALTTTEPMFSSFERESDESPPSSVVLTPPDSAPLYSRGLSSNDGHQAVPKDARDISVVPLSGRSKPPPPASQASAAPVAKSTNLLSRLAQERSALIAAGGSGIAHSQAQPLPIPMKQQSASAADIAVKAEPTDDLHAAAISSSSAGGETVSSPARPSPVTRGQSKRGTRSSQASASTNAVYTSFNFGGSSNIRGEKSASPAATNTTTKRKPLRGRKSTNTRKKDETKGNSMSRSGSAAAREGEHDDDDPDADDSTKRQQFLERNRVAACKSRQKKKEKVAGLEQYAADLCARNNMLQQTVLALRQEAIALRQLVHAHIGCSCEHAQGYIARDAAGGGIATIDQLAGRVLTLDYSIPPAMGTEDDVYSFLDRGGEAGGMTMAATSPTRPAAQPAAALMGSAPGPAIPIVARPSAAAASSSTPTHGSARSSSVSPVRRTGMMTRRSSMAVHAAASAATANTQQQQPLPAFEGHHHHNRNDAAFRAAVANNHLGLSLDGSGSGSGPLQLRATSAPPTTPGWGDAAPTGDYFAPKRARVSVAA